MDIKEVLRELRRMGHEIPEGGTIPPAGENKFVRTLIDGSYHTYQEAKELLEKEKAKTRRPRP